MDSEQRFLRELAEGIIAAGAVAEHDLTTALAYAAEVLAAVRDMEPYAYPNLVELHGRRYVYQWDETPQVLTVMLWDDEMWRDMARIVVPPDLISF